jgi:hypothetical protein
MSSSSDDAVARAMAAVLADPAYQAARDQLQAAARDHQPMDAAQEQALAAVVDLAIRRAVDELGIPPERLPAVLEAAARHFERGD